MFDTFDCLAAADVIVGSKSSFSEAAAAVSTNIKLGLWTGQTEQQDRISLNDHAVVSSGEVSLEEQSQIDKTIFDWWHCSKKDWQSAGSDAEALAADGYYQTVR